MKTQLTLARPSCFSRVVAGLAACTAIVTTAVAQYTPPAALTALADGVEDTFTWSASNVFVVLFIAAAGLTLVARMIGRGLSAGRRTG